MQLIDAQTAQDIRARENALRQWMGKRNSYHPSELPAGMQTPTNDERSALEVYEFVTNPPEKYFLYISEEKKQATTWTGDKLGECFFGTRWRDNFGGLRVAVTIKAINGKTYHGTYYKSAGDYAQVKLAKRAQIRNAPTNGQTFAGAGRANLTGSASHSTPHREDYRHMGHYATYSPEDNKLRLYPAHRLDTELYQRVKAMGFVWAAKQELFVAPKWTPGREDFLIELCGEIDDEDTSLVERAEDRAERFGGYQERRADDAERAYNAAGSIAERFAGGQPILVGHHSEKKARKDKERIENTMRTAVKMWETSEYWERRAKGALLHAKYKELPAVRARRIKTIEAERRSSLRDIENARELLAMWSQPGLTHEGALIMAARDTGGTFEPSP